MATIDRLPKELTRGYANQFLDALNRVPIHKALTIKDLSDLDDAELAHTVESES